MSEKELQRQVDDLQRQLDTVNQHIPTLLREPVQSPYSGSTESRLAIVTGIIPNTQYLIVQPVKISTGDVENTTIPVTFENDGDEEIVFVWAHMQSEDFEQLISGAVDLVSTTIVELKFINDDWYAYQTLRWSVEEKRSDLVKGTC